jgi:hypothetical protein
VRRAEYFPHDALPQGRKVRDYDTVGALTFLLEKRYIITLLDTIYGCDEMAQLHKDNHYVPQFYLKNWSNDGKTVWMYRRLVSHKNVEWWKKQSIENTAYFEHLYARQLNDSVSDEFENWLNYEIETPAKDVLEKINSNDNLTRDDLQKLIRFTAAQIVRTPAYFAKNRSNWIEALPQVIEDATKKSIEKLMRYQRSENWSPLPTSAPDKLIPLKCSVLEQQEETDTALIKIDTIVGRSMWLSNIKRMATKNIEILLNHKWSIIEVASGIEWPTSDDPVIRLSYRDEQNYSFDGGIKQKNAEILFPLSPSKLLYTKVGSRQPIDRFNRDIQFSELVRRFILEHSFLHVYSKSPLKGMFQKCPRVVNEVEYKRINAMLKNWHLDNAEGEQEFLNQE